MTTKHTPGPWHFMHEDGSHPRIVAEVLDADPSQGRCVVADLTCAMRCSRTDFGNTETHANARLIAAAPELLEAAKDLRDAAEVVGELWEKGDLAGAIRNLLGHAEYMSEMIAKAEGAQC